MASSKEKFQIVLEAQDLASRKIRELNKQLAALGGPKLVKSTRAVKKLEREIALLGGTSTKSKGLFTRFTRGIAAGNIIANAASSIFRSIVRSIKAIGTATRVAANVEELGNVLMFVGQQAGHTRKELDTTVTSLRKAGIAQKESNQAVLRGIQGSISLTDTIKLGRIAQNAATIGQVNSSEAFQTLIDAVVKGRVVMLKSLGIQGTFQAQYKKLAKTLGKAQTELTNAEKKTARLNLVFEGGKVIAGAYETAMGSASKQMRSFDRIAQDLQISVGQHLVPSFGVLVTELTSVTKQLTAAFDEDAAGGVNTVAVSIGIMTAHVVFATKAMFNFGQLAFNVFSLGVIAPVEAAITAVSALTTALSDPFNLDKWSQAGEIMSGVMDGFKSDWADVLGNIDDIDAALLTYEQTVAKLEAPKQAIVDVIINGDGDGKNAAEEARRKTFEADAASFEAFAVFMAGKQKLIRKARQTAAKEAAESAQRMQAQFVNGLGNMTTSLIMGRKSFSEIFQGIASDFMQFFIKKALNMVIMTFIPGLGGLLGGMFDTPVNDRMAANQGRDFMSWFIKGALAEARGGSEMAVGITQSTNNRITPVAASGGGGGGGMVVMNVSVSGNVMSDEFIERTVAPRLQRLVSDGRSLLNIQSENQTGGRDVSIN